MEGAFRFDSKLFQIMDRVVNLVKLNLIWMIFCIPVITMGAANCALHQVAGQIVRGNEGYIFRSFAEVFKKKFRQATLQWIPMLIIGVGIWLDYCFWKQIGGSFAGAMKGFTMALGILYLFLSIYLYPLIARMENGFRQTIRNAGLLAFKYFPQTLYMALWLAIIWFVGKIWAFGLLLTLLAGVSSAACLHASVLRRIFEKEESADGKI